MALTGNGQVLDMKQFEAMPGMNPVVQEPFVQILEEPRARGLRFRYECEGRAAGSIPGETSTPENRTYPKIQIYNSGASDAIVVVSTVTKDEIPRPHPHSLVGKDCKRGVCTVKLKKQSLATFPNLGIQCAKKKAVRDALEERKQLRVDPFQTGFEFEPTSFDLSTVRLCFQVFLPDSMGKFTRIVRPVVSQCIYDRKTVTDLVICRISRQAGVANGGQDVFLLCDKVNKDDIEVRFYEEDKDKLLVWEARGDFGQPDVHRQFAIVFRTPPYRQQDIQHPVTVHLQLRRPSDGEKSDPLEFTYTPIDRDPHGLTDKRLKRLHVPDSIMYSVDTDMQSAESNTSKETKQKIQNRILAKPRRSGHQAATATVVKQEDAAVECMAQQEPMKPGELVGIDYGNAGIDAGQISVMMSMEPNMVNQPGFEWAQYIVHPGVDQSQQQQQQLQQQQQQGLQPASSDNGESAHNLLTDLAEGGNTSLTLDTNSLLNYLEMPEDPENSSLLLNQFLSNPDTEMS